MIPWVRLVAAAARGEKKGEAKNEDTEEWKKRGRKIKGWKWGDGLLQKRNKSFNIEIDN